MKVNTQPYKGARDFYPEDKRVQKWLFDTWRMVVERYGYEEYDAPILEPTDLFLLKGNQEIIQEQTYTFKDRGDRSVTIRTEITPTVSRLVAGRRQELSFPLRWYSIPNMWRYERMQRGRLREFWQLNLDLFGVSSIEAEIEMLQIADELFRAFNAKRSDYVIKVNSRKFVNALLSEVFMLDSEQSAHMIRTIDKKDKVDPSLFRAMVASTCNDESRTDEIVRLFSIKDIKELPEEVRSLAGFADVCEVVRVCAELGLHNIQLDIGLMRGFDYYTDIVFEAFDTNPENKRALLGGGRYDGLVGLFGVEPVATVGFGMGDVGFMNFLSTHGLLKELPHSCELAILIRENNSSQEVRSVAAQMREMGVATSVDFSERKLDKQFKAALKSGVRYLLFIESEDASKPRYILKDTKTGKEERHSLQRIVSIIKDARKKRVRS